MNDKNFEHDVFPFNDFDNPHLNNDFEVKSAKNSENLNPATANFGSVEPGKNQMLFYHYNRVQNNSYTLMISHRGGLRGASRPPKPNNQPL